MAKPLHIPLSDLPSGPYSGKPYYCAVCDLGFGEFMACEEPDCRLESAEEARLRAAAHAGRIGQAVRR